MYAGDLAFIRVEQLMKDDNNVNSDLKFHERQKLEINLLNNERDAITK